MEWKLCRLETILSSAFLRFDSEIDKNIIISIIFILYNIIKKTHLNYFFIPVIDFLIIFPNYYSEVFMPLTPKIYLYNTNSLIHKKKICDLYWTGGSPLMDHPIMWNHCTFQLAFYYYV